MAVQYTLDHSSKSFLSRLLSNLASVCQNISLPAHKIVLFFMDTGIFLLSIFLASLIYTSLTGIQVGLIDASVLFISLTTIYALLSRFNKILTYQVVLNKSRHTGAVFKTLTTSLLFIFLLATILVPNWLLAEPEFMGIFFLTLMLTIFLVRIIIVPRVFYSLVRAGLVNRRLLIVGVNPMSLKRAEFLRANKDSYFNVIGFVSEDIENTKEHDSTDNILGTIHDITGIVKEYGISDILLCSNSSTEEELFEIIKKCRSSERTIHVVSNLYGVVGRKMEVEEVGVLSSFRIYPHSGNIAYEAGKRAVDILGSLTIILGLLPLWLFIAAMIRLDSRGPIFYKPKMIGMNGETFSMYKFRSMYHNCSKTSHQKKVQKMILENGDTQKLKNDPRITKVGRVLRKISFDEFPQLINVLKGNMSLVGPRPCLPYEYEVMKDWQKQRVTVKPGMTGLWQIKGRDEVLFNEQIILDLYYVEHKSFLFDLVILFETIPVVIFGKGGS